MPCRHSPGDPACTSGNSPADLYKKGVELVTRWGPKAGFGVPTNTIPAAPEPPTPDAERYQILDVAEVQSALVVRVKYPSCERCSYEGVKVLVFLETRPTDALRWTRIDPHFGDPSEKRRGSEAPSPAARFPASDEGWADALEYARSKVS